MWTSRSQPDMALVGVKSVLSPRPCSTHRRPCSAPHRPCSAPHVRRPKKSLSGPLRKYRRVHRNEGPKDNGADEESNDGTCSNGFSNESAMSCQSANQSTDSENNRLTQPQAEDENSVDTAIDLGENFFQPNFNVEQNGALLEGGAYRLINQNSKDSALGSSSDGFLKDSSDDHGLKSPSLETPREIGDFSSDSRSASESESDLDARISSCLETSIQNQTQTDDEYDEGNNKSEPNALSNYAVSLLDMSENILRAPPSSAVPSNPSYTEELKQTSSPSSTSAAKPLAPAVINFPLVSPKVITTDMSMTSHPDDTPTSVTRSGRDLQEVIDLKVVEAQKSGHLDLSNLGLPFFPSAVLLTDGSMIHRVSLQDNGLVEIPGAALMHLSFVTWLDLRYNLLQYLPSEIAALTQLQVLLLQGNNLTGLPPTLGTLRHLTTLQVSENPISFPPRDVISGGTRAILKFLKDKCVTAEKTPASLPSSSAGINTSSVDQTQTRPLPCNRSEGLELSSEGKGSCRGVDDSDCSGGGAIGGDSDSEERLYGTQGMAYCESDDSSDECPHLEERRHSEDRVSRPSSSLSLHPHTYSSSNFRVAIKNTDACEDHDVHLDLHAHPQDTERETLGRPSSPSSPCLLTPNVDLPTRAEYDLTVEDPGYEQDLEDSCLNDDTHAWACECFRDTSPISKEKFRVINKICDPSVKHKLLKNLSPPHDPLEDEFDVYQGRGVGGPAHRASLHLRLQGDRPSFEDDMESLEGDLGEGYRRPHSEPVGEKEKDSHRQMCSNQALCLPVVSLQLQGPDDQRPRGSNRRQRRSGRRTGDSTRESGDGARRMRTAGGSRKHHKDIHKPKLVTVTEVHKRAREERRRQRERLAAAREMCACQRLKTAAGLEEWREETRQLQDQQRHYHNLHRDSFLPAVCGAPFAIDGTMLTPRARSKMKPREERKRSPSPTLSDVSGVCAEVKTCLEDLKRAEKAPAAEDPGGAGGGGGGGREGGMVGGTLVNTASIVTQLSHLRRQLNRLRVNCVI